MKGKFSLEKFEAVKPGWLMVFVALLAGIAYSRYGFQGTLYYDDGLYFYGGKLLTEGIPPHINFLIPKTPLTQFVTAIGVLLAPLFSISDLLAVRIVFFVLGCLTAAMVYLLGRELFSSNRLGMIAALTFISFHGFGRHAASGPRPKSPLVLFGALTLWLAARRNWFWAAFCGGVMFLFWQPTAVYPLVIIYLAYMQSTPGTERRQNMGRAVAGTAIPLVTLSAYMAWRGAFAQMITDAVIYPFFQIERPYWPWLRRLLQPFAVIASDYAQAAAPILLGFMMLALMIVWRWRLHQRKALDVIKKDPFAALILTVLIMLVWSMADFQGFSDLYVFLAPVAIGFAWMVDLFLEGLEKNENLSSLAGAAFFLVCIGLYLNAGLTYTYYANDDLLEQTAAAQEISRRYLTEPDDEMFVLGQASVHFFLDTRHSGRYISLIDGQHNVIESEYPGGFAGWLDDRLSRKPAVIVMGPVLPDYVRQQVLDAIKDHGYRPENSVVLALALEPAELAEWIEAQVLALKCLCPGK